MNAHWITKKRLLVAVVPATALVVGGGVAAAAATGAAHGDGPDAPPPYHSSVTTNANDDGGNEGTQDLALARLATVTLPQAETAASQAVPGGTVIGIDLGNEGGNVVYTATVVTSQGTVTDVVIDAGNGHVLAQQADSSQDRNDGPDASEQSSTPPAPAATTAPTR